MEAKREERPASQRDYTPHEHEELLAIASTARRRPKLVAPPNLAYGSPLGHSLNPRRPGLKGAAPDGETQE
jgi:hypothetical protein